MARDPKRPGRRRQPKRKTGHEILEAVIAASEQLLTSGGLAGFTTKRLAELSGVSVGSIYQYFESKQAVIAELARRLEQRAVDAAAERVAREPTASLSRLAELFVGVLLDGELGDGGMRRALLVEVPRGWIEAASAGVDERLLDTIAALIRSRPAEARQEQPEMMSFIAHHAVEAVVEAAVLRRPDYLEDPAFREELEHLVKAYLRREPSPGDDEPVP